jgi:hypothetical protein
LFWLYATFLIKLLRALGALNSSLSLFEIVFDG